MSEVEMAVHDARAQIFDAMRAASPTHPPAIERAHSDDPAPSDLRSALRESLSAAGGELIEIAAATTLADALPELGNTAQLWSAIDGCTSRGVATTATRVPELACLDVTILPGALAVAESGAVWNVPRSPLERAAALLAETLILVVPAERIVATLHEAYAAITPDAAAFGWFLSGPSKTADIEQALVLGAHGPRRMQLVLVS